MFSSTFAQPPSTPEPAAAVGRRELALYVAAMLAIEAVRVALIGGPQFFNDSYQYLSIADNLREHGAIETSIVHFDEERARGRLPAPETTFPAGYSLLICSLSWTGIPLEWIGLLISIIASIGVLPLLYRGSRALALSPSATRGCLLLWTFSAQASKYGVTLYAEAVFTVAYFAAVVLLLEEVRTKREPSWRIPAAFLLAGAAFWLRYAGLFFIAALHLFALARMVRDRRWSATWIASLATCDVLVGLLIARNVAVAGVWTGGNSRPVHNGAAVVLRHLGVSAYELALGSIQDPRSLPFGLFVALLCAGVFGAVTWLAWGCTRPRAVRVVADRSRYALLLLCALVYCGGITYAGFTTHISFSARMFVPLLPILALLAALVISAAASRVPWPRLSRWGASAFAGLLALGYLGANIQSDLAPPRIAEHREIARALAVPMRTGQPLVRWIEATVPRDAVLLAVEGQATGYLLKRRTISAVERAFTDLTWSEEEAHEMVAQFGATYVLVYPDVIARAGSDALDSELFRALASRRPPAWLELAAENPRVLVYRARL